MTTFEVPASDGRALEVLVEGDPDALTLLFHSGSPTAAVAYAPFTAAAEAAGLRLVTYSRPGYGASAPYTNPDPRVIDDVADSVEILDHLGVEEFVTLGWSGGGPRALACAALLPGRCLAAATLAGVAPFDADGLDWHAGMAPENVAEYTAVTQGRDAYEAYLVAEALPMLSATAEQAEAMGGLLSPVDRAALHPEYATYLARVFQRASAQGVIGMRDDGIAILAPWGFAVADITVPVSVWQGDQDTMVPFDHGRWLADNVPGARPHLLPGEGHLSVAALIGEILTDLRALAGR